MNEKLEYDNKLISEACEWAARIVLEDVNEQEQRRFTAWLNKSPDHVNAYLETYTALDHPMFAAAIAQVDHETSKEAGIESAPNPIWTTFSSWISRLRAMPVGLPATAIAATALVAVLSVSVLQSGSIGPGNGDYVQEAFSAEYSTVGANISDVSLPDGSVVTLGAQSSLTVAFTSGERRVILDEGEGYFAVASNPSIPFTVVAGETAVRAVGTAFDVRRAIGSVRVDVVEGEVSVQSPTPAGTAANGSSLSATLINAKAGERLIFDPVIGLTKRPTPPYAELAAWRTGRLEYFGEDLNRVVADANRYFDGDIKIISDTIGEMKVTATFPTSAVDQIFEILAEQVPITVSRTDNGDILLSASEG